MLVVGEGAGCAVVGLLVGVDVAVGRVVGAAGRVELVARGAVGRSARTVETGPSWPFTSAATPMRIASDSQMNRADVSRT